PCRGTWRKIPPSRSMADSTSQDSRSASRSSADVLTITACWRWPRRLKGCAVHRSHGRNCRSEFVPPSCAGLTRASIFFVSMDCRVKSGNDEQKSKSKSLRKHPMAYETIKYEVDEQI